MNDADGNGGGLAEEAEAPSPLPARRVSFADESGVFAAGALDGMDYGKRLLGRQHVSSAVDSGYLEDSDRVKAEIGKRKSDADRVRRAMELVRAAHELMFADTRPDGLRPITGTPMVEGQGAGGSGGLYVGLAGLRGFDLSFLGNVPRQSGGEKVAPASECLAYEDTPDSSNVDGDGTVPSPVPTSPLDTSWLEQGFLLDRKPGSLMPGSLQRKNPSENTSEAPILPGSAGGREEACKRLTSSLQGQASTALPLSEDSSEILDAGKGALTEVGEEDGLGEEPRGKVASVDPLGTTAASTAVAATALLFAPKAAVLWSPENLGADDLIKSTAGGHGQEVRCSQ